MLELHYDSLMFFRKDRLWHQLLLTSYGRSLNEEEALSIRFRAEIKCSFTGKVELQKLEIQKVAAMKKVDRHKRAATGTGSDHEIWNISVMHSVAEIQFCLDLKIAFSLFRLSSINQLKIVMFC